MDYKEYIQKIAEAKAKYESEKASLSDRDDGWMSRVDENKKNIYDAIDVIPHDYIKNQIKKNINKNPKAEYKEDIADLVQEYFAFIEKLQGVPYSKDIMADNSSYCKQASKMIADLQNAIIGHINYLAGSKNDSKGRALSNIEAKMLKIWESIKEDIASQAEQDAKDMLSYRNETEQNAREVWEEI